MAPARIIIVGDAISRGSNRNASGALPADPRPSWRYWLWKTLREKGRECDFVGPQTFPDFPDPPWTFDQGNCCYGGNTTSGWMLEKVRQVRAADTGGIAPQIALVLLGTEDCYAQVPVATSISNLKGLISELRAWHRDRYGSAGLDVVIAKIPPTTDGANGTYRTKTRIAPLNTAIGAELPTLSTAAEQVIVVDCFTGYSASYNDATGLKPNEAGEQFISAKFAAVLDSLLAGVGPAVPPTDPGAPEPGWTSDTVRAEFSVSRREGTGPLAVQFTDRSVCDRKRMGRAVVVLDGIDPEYARKITEMIPPHLFDMPMVEAVEGSNWSMSGVGLPGGGSVFVPWPKVLRHVVISKRSRPGAEWGGAGACATGYPDCKVSLPVADDHLAAGNYESPAQILLHELLHTVPNLESSDAMRTSEGFRGWLREHPSQVADDFLADPAGYPENETILGLYYDYLIERYLNHPTLWSMEVSYLWTFGDCTTSTERNPAHTYENPGTYPVTLKVTAPWGEDVSETTTITVYGGTQPPVADFDVSVREGEAPLGVQFTDRSTGGTPLGWTWDFGDGRTSHERNPNHIYDTPGVYSPSLYVANEGGSDTMVKQYLITVTRPPLPAPAVHELGAAGYLDMLALLADAFGFIELRDEAGAPIAPRVPAAGRVSWTVDQENLLATLRVRINATDAPGLPFRVGGVAFYESETGGEPLTTERFEGPAAEWPRFTLPTDTLDVDVLVNIIAETVVPRLTNLVLENVSGECGTAMIVRFRVVNVTPGWKVEIVDVPETVVAGSAARIRVRVVRGEA